ILVLPRAHSRLQRLSRGSSGGRRCSPWREPFFYGTHPVSCSAHICAPYQPPLVLRISRKKPLPWGNGKGVYADAQDKRDEKRENPPEAWYTEYLSGVSHPHDQFPSASYRCHLCHRGG